MVEGFRVWGLGLRAGVLGYGVEGAGWSFMNSEG